MHQSTVEAIAREFSGLEVDIATDIETRIAKLLIGCGFLKVESHTLDGAVYETFELTEKNYEWRSADKNDAATVTPRMGHVASRVKRVRTHLVSK